MTARVSGLTVFPVKSMRGALVTAARLRPWGFEGDRRWLVVDPDGTFISQRSSPRLSLVDTRWGADGHVELSTAGAGTVGLSPSGPPVSVGIWRDTVEAVRGDPAADRWLSEVLDREVRLVHLPDPATGREIDQDFARPGETVSFADGYPVLVTNEASLAELNQWQHDAGARTVPMDRFRPSITVTADAPWAEDDWAEITVGEVTLRLVKPCARCVVTAVDPSTGTIPPGGPLRQLGRHRPGISFGVNAIPAVTGTVHVGDEVAVVRHVG